MLVDPEEEDLSGAGDPEDNDPVVAIPHGRPRFSLTQEEVALVVLHRTALLAQLPGAFREAKATRNARESGQASLW